MTSLLQKMTLLVLFLCAISLSAQNSGEVSIVNGSASIDRLTTFSKTINYNASPSLKDRARLFLRIKAATGSFALDVNYDIDKNQTSYTFKELMVDRNLTPGDDYTIESWLSWAYERNGNDYNYKTGPHDIKTITITNTAAPDINSPVDSYTRIVNDNFGTSQNISNKTTLGEKYYPGPHMNGTEHAKKSNSEEWQNYQPFSSDNFVFSSNSLKIIAKSNSNPPAKDQITSGCIRSQVAYKPTNETSYYFETRLKLPTGKGMWPAFWLFREKGNNSKNGEIDVFEVVNKQHEVKDEINWEPTYYHANAHANGGPAHKKYGSIHRVATPLSDAYHVWGCEWTTTHIKFYLDGKQFRNMKFDVNNDAEGWGGAPAANFLVNLAAGGSWAGNADVYSSFPATLEIDYLRVYKKSTSNQTTYNLTVTTTEGGSVTKSPDLEKYEEETVVTLTATPESGYKFDEWTGSKSSTSKEIEITMDSDKTMKAHFSRSTSTLYTLTVTSGTGSGDYEEGEEVSITADTAESGKQFDKWTGDTSYLADVNESSTTLTMPAREVNIAATYKDKDVVGDGYRYLKYTVTGARNYEIIELSWLEGETDYPRTNLTSNTSESGVIVSGSFGRNSYRAFDGNLSQSRLWTGFGWYYEENFITVDFGSSKVSPTKFRIHKNFWGDLRSFTCEGSNDGSTWTLLLSQTVSNNNWTAKTFTFDSARPSIELNDATSFVYPNPGAGLFHLNYSSPSVGKSTIIKVFTVDGRLISELKSQKNQINFTQEVDLINYESGFYIIEFKAGEYQNRHRVIKK